MELRNTERHTCKEITDRNAGGHVVMQACNREIRTDQRNQEQDPREKNIRATMQSCCSHTWDALMRLFAENLASTLNSAES